MYKRILVPTDGSKLSDKAIKEAARLAKMAGADVLLLHVRAPLDGPLYSEGAPLAYPSRRRDKELEEKVKKIIKLKDDIYIIPGQKRPEGTEAEKYAPER